MKVFLKKLLDHEIWSPGLWSMVSWAMNFFWKNLQKVLTFSMFLGAQSCLMVA